MIRRVLVATAIVALPQAVWAHSFGRLYNLPVPIWMYLYGAAAALVVSFLIVGYFIGVRAAAANERTIALERFTLFRFFTASGVRVALRVLSVFLLLLTIATGLFGTNNPYQNFNMTFFWIIFVLAFAYLVALIGDVYATMNPWRVLVEWIERAWPNAFRGRVAYPGRWAYYPALVLYMAFIWIELFGRTRPYSLSLIVLAYTGLTLGAAWVFGKSAWFRYGEFFAVFFRLIGLVAPIAVVREPDGRRRVQLRQPFLGLLRERAEHMSLLLFVLFMLSSTAFDGMKETVVWVRFFWTEVFHTLMPLAGENPTQAYPVFRVLYVGWQTGALLLSPFLYLAVYMLFIALAKALTRSPLGVRELGLRFAYTLIPIALVYNVTHYYTLLATQGTQIVRLLSDPFGVGWNLLGTRGLLASPIIPDAGAVWHTQVWLILVGHIISVYLAHVEALRTFPTHRQAIISQLPMLLLMVGFTTAGLWILAQPISGQMLG